MAVNPAGHDPMILAATRPLGGRLLVPHDKIVAGPFLVEEPAGSGIGN